MSASTARRTFLKTVALAGAALPVTMRCWSEANPVRPKGWQIQNELLGVYFDVASGEWQVWRKGKPLLVNAFSRAFLAEGSRQTTEPVYTRTLGTQKFTDALGSGEQLIARCVDGNKRLDFEIRFWLYENREALVVETVCQNVSREAMMIPRIRPIETAEGGGCFWPGTSKVLTNGQIYYDAGRVLDFTGGKEISSWWNVGFSAGAGKDGIVVGYLENRLSQGQIRVTPSAAEASVRFALKADSTYEKEFVLKPGGSVSSDRFLINIAADPFAALETYAQAIADFQQVKLNPPINGWCSWFSVFGSVSEDEVIRNAEFASQHLKAFGFEYIQVDDGFYRAFGDWEANERFPHGMKWLAQKIKSLGLKPGIWLAPYAIAEGTEIYKQHRDWLIQHPNGRLKQIGPGLVEGSKEAEQQNPKLYALDITHPDAAEWLRKLFNAVANDWGYEFVKIDFVEWTLLAAERYYDPTITKAAIYRRGVEIMRQALGPDRHLLDCGPGNVSVGLIDSMRIELDQPPVTWQQYYLHPASSAPAAAKRYYFHNRTWINDDDHVFLANLTPRQAQAAVTIVSLSGGNMIAGDRLADLDPIRLDILKKGFPSFGQAARPIDLFENDKPELFALPVKKPFGEWLVLGIFNGDPSAHKEKTIELKRLGLDPSKTYVAYDFWNQKFFGELRDAFSLRLEPSSVVLLAIHESRDIPHVISTDRHISQGGVELENVGWDAETRTFHGTSSGAPGTAHNVYIHLPEKHPWEQRDRFFFHDFPGYTIKIVEEQVLRVHVRFSDHDQVRWMIDFKKLFGK